MTLQTRLAGVDSLPPCFLAWNVKLLETLQNPGIPIPNFCCFGGPEPYGTGNDFKMIEYKKGRLEVNTYQPLFYLPF